MYLNLGIKLYTNIGDPHIRFHDLRHNFAELAQGINSIHIAKLTRHSSLEMVERYVHPIFSDLQRKVWNPWLNLPTFCRPKIVDKVDVQ